MIEIEAMHHVSLAVTDLKKAKQFYSEILGLPEIDRPNFDFEGAWYQVGPQQLHLIVYPEATTLRGSGNIDTKDGHMAIRIKDYKATRDYLLSRGLNIAERPYSDSGFSQIFCEDPDGNLIELNVEREDLNI